jgi:hypothetical protein
MKINLSSQLITDLSNKIDTAGSLVRETQSKHLQKKGKTQFAYDVYCHTTEICFGVLLSFLSHGRAFAYCSCGLPQNERCIHIEEALLFHQERSQYELENFFGEDVITEEAVF